MTDNDTGNLIIAYTNEGISVKLNGDPNRLLYALIGTLKGMMNDMNISKENQIEMINKFLLEITE